MLWFLFFSSEGIFLIETISLLILALRNPFFFNSSDHAQEIVEVEVGVDVEVEGEGEGEG